MRGDPTTVGRVVKRMRGILGHLSTRDREIVLEGCEAIVELSQRLFEATHVEPREPAVSVRKVAEAEVATS